MWKSIVRGFLGASLPLAAIAAPALAQEVEEGREIQVAPDRPAKVESERTEIAPQQMPAYWIGLLGGPVSEELQSHLELPADRGILVREVVPDSPAAHAGLQQYDILLRAGGDELTGMQDLVQHVSKAGEVDGKIELELIRHGRQETAEVTPEKRPERISGLVAPQEREFNIPMPGREGRGFQFPNFGPQGFAGQPFAAQQMPEGVAITIKREGDQPAEITVKRGEETWTVIADDPKSLEQLPEDLRPLVSKMARGNAMLSGFPNLGQFQPFGGDLQQRLEAMERQMHELEQQLDHREN